MDNIGWYYFYDVNGKVQWQWFIVLVVFIFKILIKVQQGQKVVQDIIDSLIKEIMLRYLVIYIFQWFSILIIEFKKEKWCFFLIEKQMKIYENIVSFFCQCF